MGDILDFMFVLFECFFLFLGFFLEGLGLEG